MRNIAKMSELSSGALIELGKLQDSSNA